MKDKVKRYSISMKPKHYEKVQRRAIKNEKPYRKSASGRIQFLIDNDRN